MSCAHIVASVDGFSLDHRDPVFICGHSLRSLTTMLTRWPSTVFMDPWGRVRECFQWYLTSSLCKYTLPDVSRTSNFLGVSVFSSMRNTRAAPKLTARIHLPLEKMLSMWGSISPSEARCKMCVWVFSDGYRVCNRFNTRERSRVCDSPQDERCISR